MAEIAAIGSDDRFVPAEGGVEIGEIRRDLCPRKAPRSDAGGEARLRHLSLPDGPFHLQVSMGAVRFFINWKILQRCKK
ncbi:MAG: hypothetical protein ACJAVR_003384 [Paracoccaceae bacterium]|jgi:hypothetical protein